VDYVVGDIIVDLIALDIIECAVTGINVMCVEADLMRLMTAQGSSVNHLARRLINYGVSFWRS
jgi:hypothetical protein